MNLENGLIDTTSIPLISHTNAYLLTKPGEAFLSSLKIGETNLPVE